MVRMEMGIAASITCPTFKPEYAEATVKITQNATPQTIDLSVNSGVFASAGMMGM